MNCPSCGSPLQSGARFCGVCGHKIDPPVSAPVVKAPLQAQSHRPGMGAPAAGLAPRKPVQDPFIGNTLNNRFSVESKLGEGGFGAVYQGTQIATGRKVAIKLLHPEMTRDDNLVQRFKREGKVLCNLRDAHTITTYDFDQTPDGTLYIAMELLEGRSLHQVFHDEAPIAWQRVATILSMMCSSLSEAHGQGIVHRDLKPENIYLEKRPQHPEFVKILDFGIAKVMKGDGSVDPHAAQLTATGQTLGTLEYMSPEQLMGKALDGRSDIYALGVLAYELLTGRLPFPDAKGPAGLITAQLKQTPKPPSTMNPGGNIPPGIDRIVGKCLEKDKNNRFGDVGILGRALQDCIAAGGQWGEAPGPLGKPPTAGGRAAMMETRKGEPGSIGPAPSMPGPGHGPVMQTPMPGAVAPYAPAPAPMMMPPGPQLAPQPMMPGPPPVAMQQAFGGPAPGMMQPPSGPSTAAALRAAKGGSRTWLFVVIAIVILGGVVGGILAFLA